MVDWNTSEIDFQGRGWDRGHVPITEDELAGRRMPAAEDVAHARPRATLPSTASRAVFDAHGHAHQSVRDAGSSAFFGTNPLAFAIPRPDGLPPLIADMASSQVAYVTVKEYAEKGIEELGQFVDSLITIPNQKLLSLEGDDHERLCEVIKAIRPDVLVKGEDWRDKGVVGREVAEYPLDPVKIMLQNFRLVVDDDIVAQRTIEHTVPSAHDRHGRAQGQTDFTWLHD